MTQLKKGTFLDVLLVFVCVTTWGSSYVAIHLALTGFSPEQAASYRFFVAAITLLPVAIFKRVRIPSGKEFILLGLVSGVGIGVYHITVNYSVANYDANVVSFIANSAPVFIAIFSSLLLGERPRLYGWIGLFVGLVGIALMNVRQGIYLDVKMLLVLIVPLSGSLFVVLQKPLLARLRFYEVMFYSISIGAVILLIWDSSFIYQVTVAPVRANMAAIYLGILPTVIAFNAWAFVLSRTEVNRLATYIYLGPVFTVIFAYFFLDLLPDLQTILGGMTILLGVYLSKRDT